MNMVSDVEDDWRDFGDRADAPSHTTSPKARVASGTALANYNTKLFGLASAKVVNADSALEVLRDMITNGPKPNKHSFAACIDACAKERPARPGDALGLLRMMDDVGVAPDEVVFASAIHACARATPSPWKKDALRLIETMETVGPAPTVIAYASAIDSCAKERPSADFATALELLQRMKSRGLAPDSVAYSSTILSCCRAKPVRLQSALSIHKEMQSKGLKPSMYVYSALLQGCARVYPAQGDTATEILNEMGSHGIAPTVENLAASATAWIYSFPRNIAEAAATLSRAGELLLSCGELDREGDMTSDRDARERRALQVAYSKAVRNCGADESHPIKLANLRELLDQMRRYKLGPDDRTYQSAIAACATDGGVNPEVLEFALSTIDQMLSDGLTINQYVVSPMLRCLGYDNSDEAERLLRHFVDVGDVDLNRHVRKALRGCMDRDRADALFEELASKNGSRFRSNLDEQGAAQQQRAKKQAHRLWASPSAKQGDWHCSKCRTQGQETLNFGFRERCFRCGETKSPETLSDFPAVPKTLRHTTAPKYNGERRAGDWDCPECGNHNFSFRNTCKFCKGAGRIDAKVSQSPSNVARGNRKSEWACGECGGSNFMSRVECRFCGNGRPFKIERKGAGASGKGARQEHRAGDWECKGCGNHNFAYRDFCNRCSEKRIDQAN